MLCTVASIEEASLDGDKSIVVVTFKDQTKSESRIVYSRLQESISVSINGSYGTIICNRDMVWLDPDEFSIFLVSFVDA